MAFSYSFFTSNNNDFKGNEITEVADSSSILYDKFMRYVHKPGFKKKFMEGCNLSKMEEGLQTKSKMIIDKESWKFDKRIAEKGLYGVAGKVAKCHCCGVSREDMPLEMGVTKNGVTKYFSAIKSLLFLKKDTEIQPKLTR